MAVYGIYDYDFFHYENVIPNLECAKLITYYRSHNELAILVPILNPAPYTQFIIRKDYDDGLYPKELFAENCVYGGRAFNPQKYVPLEKKIEQTIPNMHIYLRYLENFGKKPAQQDQLKSILNCAHMRIAPDSTNLLSFEELSKYFNNKITGIFLHDYDLSKLKAYDLLKQLQDTRKYKNKDVIRPYPIGNKFPIKIYDTNELQNWLKIITIPNCFCLEYYGLMSDTVLHNLVIQNQRMAKQVYYNITHGCSSEDDFLKNRLSNIFIQCLFLRRYSTKILLTYDENFFVTKELEKFIELLNCWLSFRWMEEFGYISQSLFGFCRNTAKFYYTNWAFHNVTVTTEEARASFQYIREKDYDLFVRFYTWAVVKFKEGKFVNEWESD